MKKLIFLFAAFALLFAACSPPATGQIITVTVEKYGGTSYSPAQTWGFPATKISEVRPYLTGSVFVFDNQLCYVSETPATIATLTGSVETVPSTLAHRIALKFDATAGKAVGTYALTTLNGETFTLPNNAIVTRTWYDVLTTFTSSGDTATIALGIATDAATGLRAAITIANGWDAGNHEGTQDGTAANFAAITTAARAVNAVVGVIALTAGKLTLVLEYTVVN
jgi:hypothetical protein